MIKTTQAIAAITQVKAHFAFWEQSIFNVQKSKRAFTFLPTLLQSGILFNYLPSQKKLKHTCTLLNSFDSK